MAIQKFEMSLINCAMNVILTRSSVYVITNATGSITFSITDTPNYYNN